MWALLILLRVFGFSNGVPLDPHDSSIRIIGGVEAPPHYAPHMVSLFNEGTFQKLQVCGGSIIGCQLVLTAAHCITEFIQDGELRKTFFGRVGSKTWHSGGTVITFKAHHIHPGWDPVNIKNDVALLGTSKRLRLGRSVAVIGLEYNWVGGDEPSYVTGWGRTGPRIEEDVVHLAPTPDHLQLLHLSTMSPEQCNESLSDPQWKYAPALDPRVEICTFHSFGHGMCNGDSGSGLVSRITYRLIGVVSWGFACARGAPDMHARISGMADFITKIQKEYYVPR